MNISPSRFYFALAVTALASAIAFLAPVAVFAEMPTAVMSGPNAGSADSFAGQHDWRFLTKKGSFDLEISATGDGLDSVPLNSAFSYKIFFYPHIAKSAYTFSQNADGFSFHGNVSKMTEVIVRIIPAASNLVRVARNYNIAVSGSAVVFEQPAQDPIVGTYVDRSHGRGAAHFNRDGTIAFADGSRGAWVAFDPSLRIYTVTVGSDRASVKFVPGRGLIDQAGDGLSVYDTAR